MVKRSKEYFFDLAEGKQFYLKEKAENLTG